MKHPEVQPPPLQTSPEGQLAGPVTSVHEDVLDEGVQTSQPLFAVVVAE